MSKKIITKLFAYARQEKAESITVNLEPDKLCFDFCFPSSPPKSLSLPKKYENSLLKNLNQTLSIDEDEIVSGLAHQASFYGKNYYFKTTVIAGKKEKKIIIKFDWKQAPNWRLNELGLKAADKKIIQKALSRKSGLIIAAGEKNSGKSALLNALGKELLQKNKNICFLSSQENPDTEGFNIIKLSPKNLALIGKYNPDAIIIDEIEIENDQLLIEAFNLANKGYLLIASCQAENEKDLGQRLKKVLGKERNRFSALRLIIMTKIEKMPRQIEKKHDKRTMIGKFKLISLAK